MRKSYLLASMIAILAIMFATTITPVKAYTTEFYVNVDPYWLGWTELPGVDPVYGEAIYKDLNSFAAHKVTAGDVRLTPVSDTMGGWYAAGSLVVAGDFDINLPLSFMPAHWGTVKHADTGATTSRYDYGEHIYRAAGSTVAVGDTRYSNVPGYKVGSIVETGDTDIGVALVNFAGMTAGAYESFTNNLVAGTSYDYARLFVDITLITDIGDNTGDGIRGYQFYCSVDPDVLTPAGWVGGSGGYILNDFCGYYYPSLSTGLVGTVGTDTIDVSEQILGTVATGAGDMWSYMPLIRLEFIPQSETDYSKIDLLSTSLGYQDAATENWHTVTLTDGDYNVPDGPEFPLGLAPLIMLAPMIPILYVWRIRKRKVR